MIYKPCVFTVDNLKELRWTVFFLFYIQISFSRDLGLIIDLCKLWYHFLKKMSDFPVFHSWLNSIATEEILRTIYVVRKFHVTFFSHHTEFE